MFAPRVLLRLEGAAVFGVALALYLDADFSILAPGSSTKMPTSKTLIWDGSEHTPLNRRSRRSSGS